MKKLPTEISSEELLEALEDSTTTEKPTEHSVLQFLAEFNIKPGQEKISGRTLYKLYFYHTDEPVSTLEFHLILTSYFEYEKHNNDKGYYVNRKAKVITERLGYYLALKKQIKKTKNPHFRRHFENFIESHGLKRGTKNIPAQALFFFYDKWQYENKLKTRLPYRVFTEMIKLYFDTKRTAKFWCVVKIDKNFLDSHINELPTAIEWGSKYNARKKDIFKKQSRKEKK